MIIFRRYQVFIIHNYLSTFLASILFFGSISCQPKPEKSVDIRGVYGNPKPFWDKGIALKDLGVNSIFVHSGSINESLMKKARSEGLKVYAEFATLNGKNYVEAHPEAWAINEKGEQVEAASWFMGVCPTEPGFRRYRIDMLKDLLATYDLDGIWMDYVHWHAQFEEPEPILPETCFCDHCLLTFSNDQNLVLPEGGSTAEIADWILSNYNSDWRNWRCQVIYNWTEDFRAIVKNHNPEMLLGLYHCPWDDTEFNGARRYNLGLDYDMLVKTIDVFSPMVYHGRMGRRPQWVEENITWFSQKISAQPGKYPKIWPIVQAYDNPEIISDTDFELVLKGGLSGQSSGVMMFTTSAVAKSKSKTKVMQDFYLGLAEKGSSN